MSGMPWMDIVKAGANSDKGNTVGGSGGGGKERGGGGGGGGMLSSVMGRAKSDSSKATSGAMGLAMGAIQTIQANKLKKRAESAFPDLVDPSQAGFLAELGQKRKSLDTGAAFATGMQNIDASQAGTNNSIVQSSGGDAGATMQALLQSQRVAGDSKNSVIAQGQGQQLAYTQMYQGVLDQIAARKLQLQMQRSQQATAEWAAKQKSASQNLMTGIAGFSGAGSPNMSGAQSTETTAAATGASTASPISNGAFGTNWSSIAPKSATPTPESAGISNATTTMGGKAAAAPMVSGNNLLGNGLSELSLKK